MIIAIASVQGRSLKPRLSANLAVLRARSGRSICLIDTDPQASAYTWSCERSNAGQGPSVTGRTLSGRKLSQELDNLAPAYADLLINTGGVDMQETLAVLTAARLVIVPLSVDQVDLDLHYPLIARLNLARMLNPALKVLFVIVTDSGAPSVEQLAAVRRYVAHVMSATLAATLLHVHSTYDYGLGRCLCDAEKCDPEAAAELHCLYREVYPQ